MQNDSGLPVCLGTMGFHKETGKLYPIRCKRWDCPTCAPLNALDLAIRVVNGITHYKRQNIPLQFVTLTVWGRYTAAPELAYTELPKWWDRIRNKLQYRARRGGYRIEYAAFVEVQRRGVPHLHAIVTMPPMKKREFKEMAVKAGFGHQADIQPVKGKAAGWYIAKYLTKGGGPNLGSSQIPKGYKRVRFSEGFPKTAKEESHNLIVRDRGENLVSFADRASRAIPGLTMGKAMKSIESLLNAAAAELTYEEYAQGGG